MWSDQFIVVIFQANIRFSNQIDLNYEYYDIYKVTIINNKVLAQTRNRKICLRIEEKFEAVAFYVGKCIYSGEFALCFPIYLVGPWWASRQFINISAITRHSSPS